MFFLIRQNLTVHDQINPNKPDRSENPVAESREQMKWFTDTWYGMFIHWSPGCLSGKEKAGINSYLIISTHSKEERFLPEAPDLISKSGCHQ
jgi:hypothetical protein